MLFITSVALSFTCFSFGVRSSCLINFSLCLLFKYFFSFASCVRLHTVASNLLECFFIPVVVVLKVNYNWINPFPLFSLLT